MTEEKKPLLDQLEEMVAELPQAINQLTGAMIAVALELKGLREQTLPQILEELKQLRQAWEQAFKPRTE